ncbi:uncharacterized protein K452DRAFT_317917 [Aplosporella prunicola CBS 121167]|uniref:AA1-like domain-containing protein n=1 Tax=Aplosporella prunicola CBS 121167 TaxID=1176127 RepID=A0A6A6BFW1_9PEZI|nr:uncharacterized protein K452DRAFT_317917 [Aplosporella prunicola CBS 121167]KAF2143039.1 hypothetical protein K452DRAFT_317917 [Aplosporella prunicola CBS 121167]
MQLTTTTLLSALALLSTSPARAATLEVTGISLTAPNLAAAPMTTMALFSLGVHEPTNSASPEEASCSAYWDYRWIQYPMYWKDCTPSSYQYYFSRFSSYDNFELTVKHAWDETNATGTFHHERSARGAITGNNGECVQGSGAMYSCNWDAVTLDVYNDIVTAA